MTALDDVLMDLEDLVGDQLQVVTYKWLARHHAIPYDVAKRVLYQFFTKQPQKVKAMFLLSGWTKNEGRHTVKIVNGAELEAVKSMFTAITAMHVYSVQPGVPKDSADLYNADYAQSEQLFRTLLLDPNDDHLLSSNRLSTIRCPGALRDAALVGRRPQQKAATAAGAPVAGPKSAPAKLGSTLATKPVPKPAPQQQAKAAAVSMAETDAAEGESQKGAKMPATKGVQHAAMSRASPGKKGSSLQSMWGKVPSKSKGQQVKAQEAETSQAAPEITTAPTAVGEADVQQQVLEAGQAAGAAAVGALDSDNEDGILAQQAKVGMTRSRHVLEDSDDEGDPGAQQPDAKKTKASLMNDSDFEDDFQPSKESSQRDKRSKQKASIAKSAVAEQAQGSQGAPKKAASKKSGVAGGQKRKKAVEVAPAAEAQPEISPDEQAAAEKGGVAAPTGDKGNQETAANFGRVKVRPDEPGTKRRKRVMRTYYNDAGEEVTEMVEEEGSEGEEEAGVHDAAVPSTAVDPPAAAHPKVQQQGEKPAAKASGGAAKSGGAGAKKKTAPAGQKSISAFFTKK